MYHPAPFTLYTQLTNGTHVHQPQLMYHSQLQQQHQQRQHNTQQQQYQQQQPQQQQQQQQQQHQHQHQRHPYSADEDFPLIPLSSLATSSELQQFTAFAPPSAAASTTPVSALTLTPAMASPLTSTNPAYIFNSNNTSLHPSYTHPSFVPTIFPTSPSLCDSSINSQQQQADYMGFSATSVLEYLLAPLNGLDDHLTHTLTKQHQHNMPHLQSSAGLRPL
eukprot:TRINITY_DN3242_c0_g2_i2.p1 TRINITY_DN3242_c0_g2~~TRINITY_DN3242_c0_g2_i2.p1  ORF type:complete len:235 (-),score=100.39 TRINITY_DN3242_c0_g2_i2:186-845(-)